MRDLEVIIIDDDPDVGRLMEMKLSREAPHFCITSFESGRECIDYMGVHAVDCILCDYQMPVMNGMELLEELRKSGDDTPFIFVTGQGSEEVAREAFKKGAHDYFTKEIGFAHFTRIINSVEQAVAQRQEKLSRARAETALQEEKLKLETILASIGDGISIHDREFKILYQNDVAKVMLGEHVGEYCFRAYQNRDEVCEGCPSLDTFNDGGIHRAEKNVLSEEGLIDIEVTASPLRDASGGIVAAIEAMRDVSERKRAQEKISSLNRLYSVTTGINELIIRTTDRQRLFEEACRIAVERGGFMLAWVGLVDEDTKEVVPAASYGHDEGYLAGMHVIAEDVPEGRGCTGMAVRSGERFICNDIGTEEYTMPWREKALEKGYRSCGAFPVFVEKEVVGAFSVYSSRENFFDEEEVRLLDEMVSDMSFALHHIEQESSRRRAEKEREEAWLNELAALREAERGRMTLEALMESIPEGIIIADASDRTVRMASRYAQDMVGRPRNDVEGIPVDEHAARWGIHHADGVTPASEKEPPLTRSLTLGNTITNEEWVLRRPDASSITVLCNAAPIRDNGGEVTGAVAAFRDVTERKLMEESVRARERQQAAVAELGHSALAGLELDRLFEDAVAQVSRNLDVEYCKVLELLPAGDKLFLKAGVGWSEGLVGSADVPAGIDSQAGYTLNSDHPVIVEDLRSETRFSGPALLTEHGVVSGISVIIRGRERPYGVMGAHTKRMRRFTGYDVNFLQSVANVLAEAIERKHVEDELRKSQDSLARAQAVAHIGNWDWDITGNVLGWSDEIYRLFGLTPQEFGATYEAFLNSVHPEDREFVKESVNRAIGENAPYSIDHRIVLPDGTVRLVHEQAEILRDESGRAIRMIGTVQDVTELRWQQAA